MTYNFEITNLNSMKIFRFTKEIKQKAQLPVIGQLQKRVLIYLFERKLIGSISEMSTRIESDIITIQIVGSENEQFFARIKVPKCEKDGK